MEEIKCIDQLPPEGEIVFTVIDNEQGRRNEAMLKRRGGLFYFPDDSMYVYYAPTHWRTATAKETQAVRDRLAARVKELRDESRRLTRMINAPEREAEISTIG